MKKRALICGVSGQDGAYLSQFLLNNGYEVIGTSRDAQTNSFSRLKQLGVFERMQVLSLAPNDFRSVLQVLSKVEPSEIYNLSGQSSVGLSFEQPVETMESISLATLNFLETIRFLGGSIRMYNAGSSECFGDLQDSASERTPFSPRSPYAVAKSTAFWQLSNYREAYGLKVCTGILFNHESPLRPERFVTKKIVSAAVRIANGSKEKLRLGNLDISRDWGWAPEYVEAMWKMLQLENMEDFVIGTGSAHSLKEFVETAFHCVGLKWGDHVEQDPALFRPTDLKIGKADPAKAKRILGWEAKVRMKEVVSRMVQFEKQRQSSISFS